MNRVIDAYNAKLDKNTLVLFFVEASDGDKLGYMPLTGNYGFIFNLGSNVELLAHELAHGAFNLRHTFSSKSFWREKGAAPVFPEKSTQNLLDYAGGTELWKFQWDLIHDPETVWFNFLQREDEGEMIYGITWLGNYLWGLAPDEQESQIETDRAMFKHIHENYDIYFNDSKAIDLNLVIEAYKNWSVRKDSHKGVAKKVFKGVKEDKTTFSLWNKGIYFENYTLEGKTYKVAVYSKNENVSLNQSIRITSYESLRYNKSIKAGYTDNYGLIVFYDSIGQMQMVLQISGGNTARETVVQWLNYLGLLLPSEEQEKKENPIPEIFKFVQLYTLDKLNEIWGEKSEVNDIFEGKQIIEQVIADDLHVKQEPRECLKACEKIISDAGYTHKALNVIVLTTNVDGNDFDFHRECVFKAVEIIDQHLESGKPIIVGVNYKDGSSNFDGVTDHWIVITARGKDDEGIFYNFFDVAQEFDLGVAKTNKLYLQSTGILKGKCTCNRNYESQCVTMVRPLDEFDFKCCGREIFQNDNEGWNDWKKFCAECKEDPGYYNKKDERHTNAIPKP
ncbi:MAG: hypothetical protein QM786_00430 [Breznakibacter sp.]